MKDLTDRKIGLFPEDVDAQTPCKRWHYHSSKNNEKLQFWLDRTC